MKHALVTTTINVPILLEDYVKDFIENGYRDSVEVIVAGDIRTPPEAVIFCEKLTDQYGISVKYLGLKEQHDFLDKFPKYKEILPWNCIQRRNVAVLMAYYNGADIIYTIDDDNFLHTKNYIHEHRNVGKIVETRPVASEDNWYNVCENILSKDMYFYPRGYSFKHRSFAHTAYLEDKKEVRVVVNAGLWVDEPDIDAVTRIAYAPKVSSVTFLEEPHTILARYTNCPFNSQNTALHRDVIPAYCLATHLGRYDDIIASYIVKRIADHLGDYISFGLPLVNQKRNDHDVFKDLKDEMTGMQIIDRFVEWLYEVDLKGTTYRACTAEIIKYFRPKADRGDLTYEQRKFIESVCINYEAWSTCL